MQRIFEARAEAAGDATQSITDTFIRRGRFGRPAMSAAIRGAIQPIYREALDEAARLVARVHVVHLIGLSTLISACEPLFFEFCERFVDLSTPRRPGAALSGERVWFTRELSRTLDGLRAGLVSAAGEAIAPPTMRRVASALLRALYDAQKADVARPVPLAPAVAALGVGEQAARAAGRYLVRFGLIEPQPDDAGTVMLTARGIAEAESLIEDPERPTAHLPPLLPAPAPAPAPARGPAGPPRSARGESGPADPAELGRTVAELAAAIAREIDDADVRAEAEAALAGIAPQLARLQPNRAIVTACLEAAVHALGQAGFAYVAEPFRTVLGRWVSLTPAARP